MKIQCDVCEKNPATVICCADEAALCAKCDVEVHAANKLASKHQRLQLHCLSNKLPTCDICQEKAAFIFCVEDRALFCQDCDESIHSATTLAGKHQRYLATGIKVGLAGSKCSKESTEKDNSSTEPSNQNAQQIAIKLPSQRSPSFAAPSWAVDDLLEFSQLEESSTTAEKNQNIQKGGGLELGGEIDWWNDMTLFGDEQFPHQVSSLAAAEVPQIRVSSNPTSNVIQYNKWSKASPMPHHKKPRIEISRHDDDDDDEFFIVPDLG